ncbi:MAG: PmbA/TldA family metallopeptidase, partial [Acetobacteraceae bacterium]
MNEPQTPAGGFGLTPLVATDRLFFERPEATLDRDAARRILARTLAKAEDGELFLEYRESEQLTLDDGRIRTAGFDAALGFGLRAVAGETTFFAHAEELSEAALRRAAQTVAALPTDPSGQAGPAPPASNARLYSDANPLSGMAFEARTRLLAELDGFARGRDPKVSQVAASLAGEWQAVQ